MKMVQALHYFLIFPKPNSQLAFIRPKVLSLNTYMIR